MGGIASFPPACPCQGERGGACGGVCGFSLAPVPHAGLFDAIQRHYHDMHRVGALLRQVLLPLCPHLPEALPARNEAVSAAVRKENEQGAGGQLTYVATTQHFQSRHTQFAADGKGAKGRASGKGLGEALFRPAPRPPSCSCKLRPCMPAFSLWESVAAQTCATVWLGSTRGGGGGGGGDGESAALGVVAFS